MEEMTIFCKGCKSTNALIQGISTFEIGNNNQASVIFRTVIRDNPGCLCGHYNYATYLAIKGDREEAEKEFGAALELMGKKVRRGYAETIINRSAVLSWMRRYDEAKSLLEEAKNNFEKEIRESPESQLEAYVLEGYESVLKNLNKFGKRW